MRPGSNTGPSRRTVVRAFAGAVAVTAALIVVGLVLGRDTTAPPPTPTPVVDLGGIPQEGAVLGSPDATVTLIEYADPQCPGCRYYTEQMFPTLVDEYVRPGKVNTEFRGFPFLGEDSVKAYRFLLAAAEQNRLWNLQEALYRNQGSENAGWVTDELLRQLAGDIEGLDVERLFADAESTDVVETAEAAAGEASDAGIPGTPSFLVRIGDREPYPIEAPADAALLRAALDDALQG